MTRHRRLLRRFVRVPCLAAASLVLFAPVGHALIAEGTLPDPGDREPIETQVAGIDPEVVPTLGFVSGGVSIDRSNDGLSAIADAAPVYESLPAIAQPPVALPALAPSFDLTGATPQASHSLVPEPGTAVLIGVGLAGLALLRRGRP